MQIGEELVSGGMEKCRQRSSMCIDEESKEADGEDRQGNVGSAGGEDQD